MDVDVLCERWPHATREQQHAWVQKVRFAVDLDEGHVPALVELYQVVLKSGGEMQRFMEEALLAAFARIGSAASLPFLRQLLTPPRPPTRVSAAQVVEVVGEIAARTAAEPALALLASSLDHEDADVRDMAASAIVRAYQGRPLPVPIMDRLHELLRGDPDRHVRLAAGLALQAIGAVSPVETLFWAAGMAGWEEEFDLATDDVRVGDTQAPSIQSLNEDWDLG